MSLRVVHSAPSGQGWTQCSNSLIRNGYSWEACKPRVCRSTLRSLTSPAAYARPQLQKHAGAVESPIHEVKRKRWSDSGNRQSLSKRPPDHFPPSSHDDRRTANLLEKDDISYTQENKSRRQTTLVKPYRPGSSQPRHESSSPTTPRPEAIRSKDTPPTDEPPSSAFDIARERVPALSARRGSAAVVKRSPGWGRRDREWSVWEQREWQEEAARSKRKRVEIARRQQEVRERVAARQHFHSLNVRADQGLQAAQQAWDQELDRRLGGADLTKVPLPAINLVGRLIKWAIKRGDQKQRQDIRQRREEEVLRGHRMAFRSFLSDFTGRGSTTAAQNPRRLEPLAQGSSRYATVKK